MNKPSFRARIIAADLAAQGKRDPRAISRRSRAEARARGDCTLCCAAPAATGRRRCQPCADKHRLRTSKVANTNEAKAAAFCPECQASGFHRGDCSTRLVLARDAA